MQITHDAVVSIHYTLSDDAGKSRPPPSGSTAKAWQ